MAYNIQKKIIHGLTQRNLTASNFIVAHESGNSNNTGSNSLDNEVNFMTRNWKNAFVSHWVGGGGRIVQLAKVGKQQYGAGPKANPYAYAHVELARTNNIETFKKDYAAYVWLLRKLANDAGIPIKLDTGSRLTDKGIKSHDWIRKHIGGTTHTDPYAYLASFGISRAQFKKDIEKGTASSPGNVTAKPALKQKVQGTSTSTYKGDSLVDYLKSIKVDSSFNNRAKLAKQYGIKNYKGTGTQNTQLLNAMRDGKKPSKPASKPKPSNSGKHGKLKIVNVNSAAIVMDKPDRNNSKNLGTVKKGATLPLNGSVRGKNSSSGYWEVNFNGKLGYITGKFGKRV